MPFRSLSRERWARLEPLLDAALDLTPAERTAFLEGACRDDGPLRRELEELLTACDLGDSILGDPAAVAYAPLLADRLPALPSLLGGRYHLGQEIGRGGMATVYLADDPKHGRQVAIKVLHADVARLIGRDRFRREIEIAAGLSHPHILPLHDSGEIAPEHDEPDDASRLLYFVSPYVAGESLRDRLAREQRLPIEEAVRLGREIALALDYAHRQGVVHLDIKPGNILLQEGHAVVTDFGIARAISGVGDDPAARPAAGVMPLLGTPSYMSPEQALGALDVDGRSDVYSLGCVMYEMLTGTRPFTQTTPQEAVAHARSAGTPDLARLHTCAPRALAAVILRAIAPAPADRFATAGGLARALADAGRHRPPRARRRLIAMAAAAGLVAAAALLIQAVRGGSSLDPNLIAVAPFDVEAPALDLWKEGMVDVLSRNLDGAGVLRTVPASVVVGRWRGRADARSARALGVATGARLVVFGGLLGAGDSVRAAVVLLDVRTGAPVAELERRDVPARIDRLTDSLTVAVLRELSRSRHLDMARATSSANPSLAVLKAYLQGERFYRAARWDSAQSRFERALALDSTFALAYHRLAEVRLWRSPNEVPDSIAYSLMRRTSRFTRGLGPREQLLATIDSLSAEAYFAWRRSLSDPRSFDHEQVIVGRLIAAIGDGLLRYRRDPELLFQLAETRTRYDANVTEGEFDDREVLGLYDQAIAMDSAFAPAYVTPIALAAYLDGAAGARRYIQGYLAREPAGAQSQPIHLADALLDPSRAASIDAARLVDTLSADALCQASRVLRHVPDSTEILPRIARAIEARHEVGVSSYGLPDCAVAYAVDGLQFRGHLRAAAALAAPQSHWFGPTVLYNMARFGMVPADSARAVFHQILDMSDQGTMTKLYGWWAADRDTAAIQRYITHFTRGLERSGVSAAAPMMRASVAAGRAYLALAMGDTAAAIRRLMTTPDTLHECWYDNRVALVQLLEHARRDREAETRLERRWPGTSACSNGLDDVLWTLERGRVFERVGRTREAAESYAFVADAWRTADPELQPLVRESRAALSRLRARATR